MIKESQAPSAGGGGNLNIDNATWPSLKGEQTAGSELPACRRDAPPPRKPVKPPVQQAADSPRAPVIPGRPVLREGSHVWLGTCDVRGTQALAPEPTLWRGAGGDGNWPLPDTAPLTPAVPHRAPRAQTPPAAPLTKDESTGGSSRQQGTGRDWLHGHRGSMKEPTPRAALGNSRLTP